MEEIILGKQKDQETLTRVINNLMNYFGNVVMACFVMIKEIDNRGDYTQTVNE